jgi:hypothetical protein
VLLFGLLACGGGDAGEKNREVDMRPQSGGDATEVAELPAADEVIDALEGGFDAFVDASQSWGFPVETADGWLFAWAGSDNWEVAGDFDGWEGQPMDCDGELCTLVVALSEVEAVGGYKFTDGSTWNADPWSRRYLFDENGELSLIASEAAHLERHFAVHDDEMAPRTVRAWVPRGEVTHLLYAEDGQNLWDPEAMWGGWRLDESTPAGMMVVGIDNTSDRMEEYTHVVDHIDGRPYGGEGDAYADFVQDTVRPLVASHYGEPDTIGLLGSSLGGLISLHIARRHPGEFAFAASMSGTLGWGSIEDHNETIIERYAGAGHGSTAIYLDSGGSGSCEDSDGDGINDDARDGEDNYCETLQMRDVLAGEGYEYEVDLWHWWEEGASHDEVSWAERVWRPLEIFSEM